MRIENGILTEILTPRKTLVVPNGVTAIAEGLCRKHWSIHYLELPPSLRSIGDHAFEGVRLLGVSFSEGLVAIGNEAFSHTQIEAAILPDSLRHIGAAAFKYCQRLADVRLPERLETLGNGAFLKTRWVESHLGQELRVCGGRYLLSAVPARELRIPDGVVEVLLGYGSMANKGVEHVYLPDSVEVLGHGCFADADQLRRVRFSARLADVKSAAFSGCTALESAVLPDTVTVIGPGAFGRCTSLRELSVPVTARMYAGSTDEGTDVTLRWAGGTFTVPARAAVRMLLIDPVVRFLRVTDREGCLEMLRLMQREEGLHARCTLLAEWRFPGTFAVGELTRAASPAAVACAEVGDVDTLRRIHGDFPLGGDVLLRCLDVLPEGRTDLRAAVLALLEGQSGETSRRL